MKALSFCELTFRGTMLSQQMTNWGRNIVDNKNIVDNNSNSLVYLMREFLNFFLSYKFFVTVLLVINVTYRVKNC